MEDDCNLQLPVSRDLINQWIQVLNCQKISGGLTLHTGDSASLTTAGVETDPQGIPGHLVWGVKKTTGGSTPQPPAIQTLNGRSCKWL
jgi:hypothetical protein